MLANRAKHHIHAIVLNTWAVNSPFSAAKKSLSDFLETVANSDLNLRNSWLKLECLFRGSNVEKNILSFNGPVYGIKHQKYLKGPLFSTCWSINFKIIN